MLFNLCLCVLSPNARLSQWEVREFALDNHILRPLALWLKPFGKQLPNLRIRNQLIPIVKMVCVCVCVCVCVWVGVCGNSEARFMLHYFVIIHPLELVA